MSESEKFTWELTPFRIDSCKNWLMFGYPILGGWVPTAVFDSFSEYDDVMNPSVRLEFKVFKLEWFIIRYLYIYSVEEFEMFGE